MTEAHPITVAYGDGIGPEIMEATLKILAEAKARLAIETIEVGEQVYKKGISTGIPDEAWASLHRTKVLLKAPITTPQGGGYKSLNVTMRKVLGLYANVRPTISYHPFVNTKHPKMDMVIVRENEEDLYTGIEHRQSDDLFQCLKLISRSGSERIIRYAFEYAVANNRKKVTCMIKDNIMKMADGVFHQVFKEVGAEYPTLEKESYIIDIGAARIAAAPERFDVIVTQNLYGDIISDIAAEVSGSVGLAGSSNIGANFALFEAIHGSAPDIAGKGIANPSGLLLGAVMMLVHLGQNDVATRVHNAWLRTIEDGIHTGDIFGSISKQKVGTQDFAKAVIERLGQEPKQLTKVSYIGGKPMNLKPVTIKTGAQKTLVGTDFFVHWTKDIESLAKALLPLQAEDLTLTTISSKGLKLWPGDAKNIATTDQFCCRFRGKNNGTISHTRLAKLFADGAAAGIDFTKSENLYMFDGAPGFSLGQGE